MMLSVLAAFGFLMGQGAVDSGAVTHDASKWLSAARFQPGTTVDTTDVLKHLNDLRSRPRVWRSVIDSIIVLWHDARPPRMLQHLLGSEGYSLLAEVRRFLDTVRPVAPLQRIRCLERIAADHAAHVASNPDGHPHRGANGQALTQRIASRCSGIRSFGECVDNLSSAASTVILRLLFDPDVPGRGHRRNLFDPTYRSVGIGGAPCPKHPVLGTGYVVVLTFSDAE